MAEPTSSARPPVVGPPKWSILHNEEGFATAWVGAVAVVPGGTSNAFLLIQCAKTKEYATAVELGVDSDGISGLVDDFEGPGAPALKHKLGLMVVTSGSQSTSYSTAMTGSYGDIGRFVFSPAYYSGRKYIYPSLVAKPGNSVRFVITSLQDRSQNIDVSFPAIEPGSEVAKQLGECNVK